jgi:hypothetical protein
MLRTGEASGQVIKDGTSMSQVTGFPGLYRVMMLPMTTEKLNLSLFVAGTMASSGNATVLVGALPSAAVDYSRSLAVSDQSGILFLEIGLKPTAMNLFRVQQPSMVLL